ncbi:GGDEF domain-containing response regulator [Peribacillus huizhouensis]|uniref:Diguanylate cyclase (GGDEF)-like protein n=1 Tax=Peribacillus huizhouensis TaxID=1501239 RepID=A0ABR6CVB2_9BACI|nr:diguanylate cyclase [Peribacillus huizhouensis]MBA9028964.1 diguanylate cyclase (GGDEF)-like protein [Peribacillus huizhouensis]
MNLEKYKNHLIQNTKKVLTNWFEPKENEGIPQRDVYRFLHSIKGTAGTIQLGGLMQVSDRLLLDLDENSHKVWELDELRNFLFDLMELTYEYENFKHITIKTSTIRPSNAPLIQIIDDDVSMLILLKDMLEEKGWMVITNTDPEKAVNQYFEMQPDLLILDIHLPMKDGFHVLEDIQTHNEKYFIPKMIISIQNDKQTRIKAYQSGADDFIGKPIDIEEFIVKIERHIQRKKMFDQSVLIDELTQIYNRRFLEETLPRYFQEYKRSKQAFSISVVDIDYFKQVNDTYGHLFGDRVLNEFAQFIKRSIRSSDLIFRYGGEEFVIIFPGTKNIDAQQRLTELIHEFSQKVFIYKEKSFTVTFSAGLYTVDDEFVTPEEAFKYADHALYEAKRLGRARVETSGRSLFYKKNVLNVSVIDDDIIIRTMLYKIIESIDMGHLELNIAVFENGPLFFESGRADDGRDHFLIVDGVMPIMDGLEVLQKVKSGPYANQFSVLMLTGRKSKENIAQALKLGADDYVTKPFSVPELQARIERLLKREK